MESSFDDVDYFPSYEVITTPLSRGVFYDPNMRSVNMTGVNTAMAIFFSEHDRDPVPKAAREAPAPADAEQDEDEAVCEEVLLEAFSR